MRFKIDENLPHQLCDLFERRGHDADSVKHEGLKGRPDSDVWPAAIAADRALVTSDLGFSDIRAFQPGTHPGIVLFRVRTEGRGAILSRFEEVLQVHDAEGWSRCFVVISAEKIRIRRPSGDSERN